MRFRGRDQPPISPAMRGSDRLSEVESWSSSVVSRVVGVVMTDSLRGDGLFHGLWLTTVDPAVVEVAGVTRPDFVCFDAQHGVALGRLTTMTFTALSAFDVPALVRVARNHRADIGRSLDLGAAGVMVPMVETAEDARRAADACRYGPNGSRSYGMQTSRIDPLAEDYRPICAVQIETTTAIDNIDEIAAVDGVDWLYIGPADLGLSVGGVPASDVKSVFDGSHPLADEVSAAWDKVVAAAKAHGVLAGLHTSSGEATRIAASRGFQVASVATDMAEMKSGMARQLKTARLST